MNIINNEYKRPIYHSNIPLVNWGTEHMSDEEQDMIRYMDYIINDGTKILNRVRANKPVFRADIKEWQSYIRAIRLILTKLETEAI